MRIPVVPLLAVAIPAMVAAAVVLFWRSAPESVVPVERSLTPADFEQVARQQGNGSVPLVRLPEVTPTRSPDRTLHVRPLNDRPAPPSELSIPELGVCLLYTSDAADE